MDNKFLIALTVFVVIRILWKLRPAPRDPALDATDLVVGTRVLVAAIGEAEPIEAAVEAYARYYKNVSRRDFDNVEDCLEVLASTSHEVVQLLTEYLLGAEDAQRIFRACSSTGVRLLLVTGQDEDLVKLVPKDLNCLLVIDGQGELWDAYLLDFLQRVAVHGRHLVEAFRELDGKADDGPLSGQKVSSNPSLMQRLYHLSHISRRVINLAPGASSPVALFVRSQRDVALLP